MERPSGILNLSRALHVGAFEFTRRAQEDARLPRFMGSPLRGAVGWAFKRTVRVRPNGRCEPCAVRQSCLYPYLFEATPSAEAPALDHRSLLERTRAVSPLHRALTWYDWERYSHRQRTRRCLGEVVGEVEYGFADRTEAAAFLPLLVLGEVLHVGTGTTFGLGKYEILSLMPEARSTRPTGDANDEPER